MIDGSMIIVKRDKRKSLVSIHLEGAIALSDIKSEKLLVRPLQEDEHPSSLAAIKK